MSKILYFLVLVTLVASCKDAVSDTAIVHESRWEDVTDSLPGKIRVDAKAQTILNDWLEYNALEKSFDKIYTSEYIEDFELVMDELVENQKKMEESMLQMITAFNDLRNQFNVVINNTLPDELLANEEN